MFHLSSFIRSSQICQQNCTIILRLWYLDPAVGKLFNPIILAQYLIMTIESTLSTTRGCILETSIKRSTSEQYYI